MRHILLVDDDQDQALLFQEALESNLAETVVTVVQDGGEAIAADIASFDAILLDYNLPDMSGIEVLHRISERVQGPVIIITGEEALPLAVAALQEGAADFVTKTVELNQLLPHIVEHNILKFQRKALRQETEKQEREKQIQIETLKRIMMTLAHYINNAIMPIIFSAELCKYNNFQEDAARKLVNTCLSETKRINDVILRFEEFVEYEEFTTSDYLDLKDAIFDLQRSWAQSKAKEEHHDN
ncbi:MAG: response regulator [bacterium]